jgi:hypothetical protein
MLTCIGCDDAAREICNEYEEEGGGNYRCVHCGHSEECHAEETEEANDPKPWVARTWDGARVMSETRHAQPWEAQESLTRWAQNGGSASRVSIAYNPTKEDAKSSVLPAYTDAESVEARIAKCIDHERSHGGNATAAARAILRDIRLGHIVFSTEKE